MKITSMNEGNMRATGNTSIRQIVSQQLALDGPDLAGELAQWTTRECETRSPVGPTVRNLRIQPQSFCKLPALAFDENHKMGQCERFAVSMV